MSWDQNDLSGYSFSEYRESEKTKSERVGYADPRFYESRPRDASPSLPAQPEGSEVNYTDPRYYQQDQWGRQTATSDAVIQMTEYRGPQGVEHYTADVGASQREAARNGHASGERRGGLAALGGLGTVLAVMAKFGLAGVSALISIAVYSFVFGWAFAIGLVALLFIHEMGHAIVMKLKGIPVGGMVFIPMLGAAVFMNRMPRNAKDEAEVGIAGPVAGALASAVCLLVAVTRADSPGVWASLAYFGFFLNLFNLIPIVPFDGGRVLAAIDRRIWIAGFVGLVGIEVWNWIQGVGSIWDRISATNSIWLLLFIVMAATQLLARRGDSPEARKYYAVPLRERVILGAAYFGLIAVLVLGMSLAHGLMPLPPM